MLRDEQLELLSAYVDGELSVWQRKAVLQLLRQSVEARRLLRAMQQDAKHLRHLPRKQLEPEAQLQLFQTFAEKRFQPRSRQFSTIPMGTLPPWLGVAVAASVLFVVSLSSYLYFVSPPKGGAPAQPVAVVEQPNQPEAVVEDVPEPRVEKPPPPKPKPPRQPRPTPPELVRAPRVVEEPSPNLDDLIAAPVPVPNKEMFKAVVDVELPVLYNLHDLNQDAPRAKLREQLNKSNAFRVELPCQESSSRAFKRLQTALEKHGTGLIIDQVARVRLNYGQAKTNYVIFLEDVTPGELTQILRQIGLEDKRPEMLRHEFTKLVVAPMNDGDRRELSQLLGVDPRWLQTPRKSDRSGVDPSKPILPQGTSSAQGQGGSPRLGPDKSTVIPPQRLALVLAYNPVRPRPDSPEVRRFLENRRQPREGALQVLLVLRDAI